MYVNVYSRSSTPAQSQAAASAVFCESAAMKLLKWNQGTPKGPTTAFCDPLCQGKMPTRYACFLLFHHAICVKLLGHSSYPLPGLSSASVAMTNQGIGMLLDVFFA